MDKPLSSTLVGRIALGTAQFGLDYGISNLGGQTSHSELQAILELASESGIDCLDTAIGYGNSEENLGRAGVDSFKVVTKFPKMRAGELRAALLGCMTRLKVDRLYGFIGHSFDSVYGRPDVWKQLIALKEEGLVVKTGCSLYRPQELESLLGTECPLDLIQIPYNILDRRFEVLMAEAKSLGIEVYTRSVFLQGLLLMEPNELHDYFNTVKPFVKEMRAKIGAEISGSLLHWCLRNPDVDKVTIGVNDATQLRSNMDSLLRCCSRISAIPIPKVGEEILLPTRWPRWR